MNTREVIVTPFCVLFESARTDIDIDGFRYRLVISRGGHFSLFYGRRRRHEVLPEVLRFWGIPPPAGGAVMR